MKEKKIAREERNQEKLANGDWQSFMQRGVLIANV